MKPTTLAALLLTTLTCLTAHAAHIKVSFVVVAISNGFGGESVSIVEMIFDTSILPEPGKGNTLLFYPVSSTLATSDGGPFGSPACNGSTTNIEFAQLHYLPNGNTISMNANDGCDYGSLGITNMPAAFNPAMDSLPDDPAGWVPNPTTSEYHGMTSGPQGAIEYHPDFGFSGGTIAYSALELPAPSTACSPADLNEDGFIDFLDISAFLDSFAEGCP